MKLHPMFKMAEYLCEVEEVLIEILNWTEIEEVPLEDRMVYIADAVDKLNMEGK